jgi:uncharacterized membrane protein YhhN
MSGRGAGAAYVALAVADVTACALDRRDLRRWTKPLLMPALAAHLATSAPVPSGGVGRARGRLRRGVLTGLAASWAGDVALLGQSRASFGAGLGAFLGAHAAYLAGFAPFAGRPRARAALPLAVAWAGGTVALWPRTGPLRLPVAGYAGLLAVMSGAAVQTSTSLPRDAARRLGAGGLVFMASDATLAARTFLVRNPSPAVRRAADVAVMVTYTAAQWLLASGTVRAMRATA